MSLMIRGAETSGRAVVSSALSFARTRGVERRWTVMICEMCQFSWREGVPGLSRRTLRIQDVVSVPAIEKF